VWQLGHAVPSQMEVCSKVTDTALVMSVLLSD
jgi:hypothetical protein